MKYTLFLVLIFSFCFVSAIPNDAGNKIDFTYPTVINYSLIPTVNSSDFWDFLDTPADINVGDLGDGNSYIPNTNFTWFVPYTGATKNANLGDFNWTAQTFIGSGAYLHSVNFTELDPVWNANFSIFNALIDNFTYYRTDNSTYANYETNVSINWSLQTFDNWNETWSLNYSAIIEDMWWTEFIRTDNSSYRELTNNTFYYSVNISAPLNVSRDNEVYLNEWIMNETGLFYNNGSREFNIRINSTHTVFNF